MARGYSNDLRARAIAMFQEGDSAREAARVLKVGSSTGIRWIGRWTTTGSAEAKPGTGHSRSPLKRHERWLLDLVDKQPDLTLREIRALLRCERKVKIGVTSIWRFYERHKITFKKNSPRRRASPS